MSVSSARSTVCPTLVRAHRLSRRLAFSLVAAVAWLSCARAQSTAPTITSSLTATATTGIAFSYTIVATNSPSRFTAAPLPAGFAIDGATGVITGTTSVEGTFAIGLAASNAAGTGTATLTLTVARA